MELLFPALPCSVSKFERTGQNFDQRHGQRAFRRAHTYPAEGATLLLLPTPRPEHAKGCWSLKLSSIEFLGARAIKDYLSSTLPPLERSPRRSSRAGIPPPRFVCRESY